MNNLKPWQGYLVLFMAVAIIICGTLLRINTTILLLADGAATCAILTLCGMKYSVLEAEIKQSIAGMILPVLRLMVVGIMISAWMASGTVPYMIYGGIQFLVPRFFLPVVCLLCAMMSFAAGTSWGTVATVGIACMSIAVGLGIPTQLTAGAIVVGAMLGDKLSPLSDSVLLTASLSDVPLAAGLRHCLYSTGPAFLCSLAFFIISGLPYAQKVISGNHSLLILTALQEQFVFHPILLLPPLLLFMLIALKVPTLPAFAAGVTASIILAAVLQRPAPTVMAQYLFSGYHSNAQLAIIAQMLDRGGLMSMLPTIGLLLSACVFGAPIRASGAIELLLYRLRPLIRSGGLLSNAVLLLHAVLFSLTGSYYVSAPMVATMTKDFFPHYGLDSRNLMRVLQDTGAGLSAIVPWAATGIYITTTLGLSSTLDYILYAPMLWISILISLFMGFTGLGLARPTMQKKL